MAKPTKEIIYWTSVFLYGVILFGVLLYFRFPTDKFRHYCERMVEGKIKDVSCTIGSISYVFPLEIALQDLHLARTDREELLFEDPRFSLVPKWNIFAGELSVRSQIFGSRSSAEVRVLKKENRIALDEIHIDSMDLEKISFFRDQLDRKMTGKLVMNGQALIDSSQFRIISAQGKIEVGEGSVELKKPILELNEFGIDQAVVNYSIENNTLKFVDGEVKNQQLNTVFHGSVTLSQPIASGMVSLKGSVDPQSQLYQKNKQLKVIVARMQKRYKGTTLPFTLAGTVGKPTFVFGE